MGTRHLTCVVLNGQYKVAQYGQWDGYPDGQGITALTFLRDKMDRATFEKKVAACSELSATEGRRIEDESRASGISWQRSHPELSRDTGADILELVQNSKNGLKLSLMPEFAADSLMCEWAWLVDLDANVFGAYEGFNKEPVSEDNRFASFQPHGNEYHQVKFVRSWPLDALPTNDEFLAAFVSDEEGSAQ